MNDVSLSKKDRKGSKGTKRKEENSYRIYNIYTNASNSDQIKISFTKLLKSLMVYQMNCVFNTYYLLLNPILLI